MRRGIIAPPGNIVLQQEGFLMKETLTAEEIRYYLMYWDKIIIPTNNLIHIGFAEEEELVECGAIWRPRVQLVGSFSGAQAMLDSHAKIAEMMMKDKSTDWVIHQIGQEISVPKNFSQDRNVLRVDISNALPSPHGKVAIIDILDFKERRKTELEALHETLDEIYLEILTSPDSDLAAKKCISRFECSLNDLGRVSKEKFRIIQKYDLTAELNMNGKDMFNAAASGAVIDFFTSGFSMPIATALGAIGSVVRVNVKATRSLNAAKDRTKLAYLSSAHKEALL
tara:strand:- start:1988 stop:2833 length:846 start_codon:yes stop_codon:yes gene_type:complete